MKRTLVLGMLLAASLAGCGDDAPPVVQNFAPLQFDYLPKLRLNVGSIDIEDHSQPVGPQDIAATSPAVPAQALARMARDRLFAAGTAGMATFVIDQASIQREPNGTLDGALGVHMDIATAAGGRGGFAEARVARQYVPGTDPEDARGALYRLTRQMMDDMNVEFEFQVRRSLKDWLETAGAVPAPVMAQPLDAPGMTAPVAPASPALPPSAPAAEPSAAPAPADGYLDPALPAPPPPPQEMSPPPTYLRPPPGETPALPPANGS